MASPDLPYERSSAAISLRHVGRQRFNPKPRISAPLSDQQLLARLVSILRYSISREASYPSKPEMRNLLKQTKEAAQLLRRKLIDPQMSALLYGQDAPHEIIEELEIIVTHAEAALKEKSRKTYPSSADGPSALQLCAIIAGLMWQHNSVRWPGKGDARAHAVCQWLWHCADGPDRGGWGKGATGWRDHLKAAKKYVQSNHPAVQHIESTINRMTRHNKLASHGED